MRGQWGTCPGKVCKAGHSSEEHRVNCGTSRQMTPVTATSPGSVGSVGNPVCLVLYCERFSMTMSYLSSLFPIDSLSLYKRMSLTLFFLSHNHHLICLPFLESKLTVFETFSQVFFSRNTDEFWKAAHTCKFMFMFNGEGNYSSCYIQQFYRLFICTIYT